MCQNLDLTLTKEEAVSNGIKLLDENEDGWREKIDRQLLNVADPKNCPLGQVYRHIKMEQDRSPFLYGVEKLGIRGKCKKYGFGRDSNFSFEELNEEWRRQIGLRRLEIEVQPSENYTFCVFNDHNSE